MLESSSAVFAALEGNLAQAGSPTDEEAAEAAEKSPDEWAAFASGLAARSKASHPRLGQPLDPRVASSALELWECGEVPANGAPGYQPVVVPYLVAVGKGNIRRLHRTDGCWKAQALAFKEYELLDKYSAPQECYSHSCRKCWPLTTPPVPEESEGGSVSSASSSSSGA